MIKITIRKVPVDESAYKHLPGRHNQKRHGWRYGSLTAARHSMAGVTNAEERAVYRKRAGMPEPKKIEKPVALKPTGRPTNLDEFKQQLEGRLGKLHAAEEKRNAARELWHQTADNDFSSDIYKKFSAACDDVGKERNGLDIEIIKLLTEPGNGAQDMVKLHTASSKDTKDCQAIINKVLECIPPEVINKGIVNPNLRDRLTIEEATQEMLGRNVGGNYDERTDRIRVMVYKKTTSLKDYPSTIQHEFGHYLETRLHYKRRDEKFFEEHTEGQKIKSCKRGDYRFCKDKLVSDYSGRLPYENGSTELFSTGIEHMFSDALRFYETAPDHFYLTISNMKGWDYP